MKRKSVKILLCVVIIALVGVLFTATAFAAGNVAGAIENTWNSAQGQVKDVVNKVVFPVVDMILAILFFVKVGTSYFECAPVKAN